MRPIPDVWKYCTLQTLGHHLKRLYRGAYGKMDSAVHSTTTRVGVFLPQLMLNS